MQCGWHERTGGLITAPPPVMCVKSHLRPTLSATTVISLGSSGAPPTTPVISNCSWTPRQWPFQLSSTTCRGMTRICWCRLSQRWKAAFLVSPTTQRSISLSPLANCDSSTAQFLPTSLDKLVAANKPEAFQITGGKSRSKRGANCLCARASTHTSTWNPGSALPSPNFPPRKPSSASFQTSTSAIRSTGMHSASGRFSAATPWGTTTISTTAATSYCWQMSFRHFRRPPWDSAALTPQTITPARVSHGTPCSRKRGLSLSFSPITNNTSSSRRVCVVASAWPQSAMQG